MINSYFFQILSPSRYNIVNMTNEPTRNIIWKHFSHVAIKWICLLIKKDFGELKLTSLCYYSLYKPFLSGNWDSNFMCKTVHTFYVYWKMPKNLRVSADHKSLWPWFATRSDEFRNSSPDNDALLNNNKLLENFNLLWLQENDL